MVKEISLFEFSKRFNTEEVCRQYLEEIRWNSILVCPFCKSLNVCKFSTGKGYGCRDCRRNFSITTGTIFDNSKIPISTWLYVMYWASLSKKNFVSIQISKNVGITQRSAWAMMMKIRTVYEQTYTKKLSGIIEIDECFLSKGIKWRRWGSINTRKLPILGLIERGGKVIVKLILDRHKATIESFILKNVETNSTAMIYLFTLKIIKD